MEKNSRTNWCLNGGVVELTMNSKIGGDNHELDKGQCFSWGNMEKCGKEMNFVCKKHVNKN